MKVSKSERVNHNRSLSKALSKVLRHQAVNQGLNVRPDGYVKVEEILGLQQFKQYNLEDLQQVTVNNDKQRFKLLEEDGKYFIRANQGHSMPGVVDPTLLLNSVTSPDEIRTCIHGTNWKAWESIKTEGLSRMKRNHIHFACGKPDKNVISGMRYSSKVHIYIDTVAALEAGIDFFISDNGVILSPGVKETGILPAKYFSKVVEAETGSIIYKKS